MSNRTTSNPRMQAVTGQPAQGQPPQADPSAVLAALDFGTPTTDPSLAVNAQQNQQPPQQPPPPPPRDIMPHGMSGGGGGGVTIPQWVMQIIPVIALIAGTIMLFAQQRADVEMLKTNLVEMKSQQQVYVTKQIFDLKMSEYDKYQNQMNQRFDKLEGLINGLYDRLPAAKHQK